MPEPGSHTSNRRLDIECAKVYLVLVLNQPSKHLKLFLLTQAAQHILIAFLEIDAFDVEALSKSVFKQHTST
jgi:hypothetical protein